MIGNQATREARAAVKNWSPIARLRYLAVWIQASPQRIQKWRSLKPTRTIHYDVDTRWNSTYQMIQDGIECKQTLMVYIR